MDIITQRMPIGDACKRFDALSHANYKNVNLLEICKDFGIKEEDAEYTIKGITATDLTFVDGERSAISVITTGTKDRDNEIVDPDGAVLTEYEKTPVVLYGHEHRGLPIGMNEWIRVDTNKRLIAKTKYYSRGFADDVYQYRKEGFPLAQSIGFIPLETKSGNELTKEEKSAGVKRKFTKWILLEYSDVPIPSNPEAVAIAVSKSLIKADESKDYGVETLPVLKDGWEELFKSGETITIADEPDKEIKGKYDDDLDLMDDVLGGKEIKDTDTKDGDILEPEEITAEKDNGEIKELEEPEEKAGRVLSRKNRGLIGKAIGDMDVAVASLQALMEATDTSVDTDKDLELSEEPVNTAEIKPGEDIITIPDGLFEDSEGKSGNEDKITIDKSELQNLLKATVKDVLVRHRTRKAQDTVDAVKEGIDKAKGRV